MKNKMMEAGASEHEISIASYLHNCLSGGDWYRIISIQAFYEDYHRHCRSKSFRPSGQNIFTKGLIEVFDEKTIQISEDHILLPDLQIGRQRLVAFIRRKSQPKNKTQRNKT